jgi:hypothetical protein
MNQAIQDAIDRVALKATALMSSQEFYFQKAQDALKAWLNLEVPESVKKDLLSLVKNYRGLQEKASANANIQYMLNRMYEIIAYCDVNARDKDALNQYENNRVLADANVRMNSWVNRLILLKFTPEKGAAWIVSSSVVPFVIDMPFDVGFLHSSTQQLSMIKKDVLKFVDDFSAEFPNKSSFSKMNGHIDEFLSGLTEKTSR